VLLGGTELLCAADPELLGAIEPDPERLAVLVLEEDTLCVTDPVLLGATERLMVFDIVTEAVGDLLEVTDPHTLAVPDSVLETEEDPVTAPVDVSLTTLLTVRVDNPEVLREDDTLGLTDLLDSSDPDTDTVDDPVFVTDVVTLRDHDADPL
jgi:hypothetical protein